MDRSPFLEPKYDLSVSETFLQTCRYFISSNQMEFLYATGEPRSLPDLPSWVPDWSTCKLGYSLYNSACSRPYHASGISDQLIRLSPDSKTLICHGEVVDTLASFSSKFQHVRDPYNWTEMQPWFQETENMTRQSKAVTDNISTVSEVHYRTLVANQAETLSFSFSG